MKRVGEDVAENARVASGVTEVGCLAHALRKFFDLHAANQSQIAEFALHEWMTLQRRQLPDGSATAKALDYSLWRWVALTRFAGDRELPVDNNWTENQIRPIAIDRNNCLFAGSLRAVQRAAAVMSLIQSARMNGQDPYAHLKDVLTRLPMHKACRIDELLPHRWQHSDI
jgi:transposase